MFGNPVKKSVSNMRGFLFLFSVATYFSAAYSATISQLEYPASIRNTTTNEENDLLDIINLNDGNSLLDILNWDTLQETFGSGSLSATNVELIMQLTNLYSELQNLEINITDDGCLKQMGLFLTSLMDMDDWAIRMFDATAKIQSGILEGNTMHVGSYDECLKIDVFVNDTKINGQYCTAILIDSEDHVVDIYDKNSAADFKLSYGFCIPAACDNTSLTEIARVLESTFALPLHLQFPAEMCDSTVKYKTFSNGEILCICVHLAENLDRLITSQKFQKSKITSLLLCGDTYLNTGSTFFAIMAVLVVSSTLYDIFIFRNKKGAGTILFIAFSFYTNGRKLFSTKSSGESLNCLNGLRVISMAWIIAAHRYLYSFSLPLINILPALEWEKNSVSTLITSTTLAVDTFFMISGLLIVYVFLKNREKGQKVSVIMFYIHRALRLTPALAALVLFYTTLISRVGSGPFWPVINSYFQHSCESNWWSTILYVQNYVHPTKICVEHSWYLAVDTQLYFISPILLFPLMRWPKRTLSTVMMLIVASCGVVFFVTWENQLGPAFYGIDDETLTKLYVPTHTRSAPWLIGILTGYVVFQCKNKVIKIHKVLVISLWLISCGIMLAIVLYHNKIGTTADIGLLKASLFNSLARPVWTIAISIIVFLCVTGHGGIINRFLSSAIFTVLIRVNYSMYLLHMVVIFYDIAQRRTPDYIVPRNLFYLFWGDLIVTLICSILWTLTFESPVLVLEKVLFGKRKRPTSNGAGLKLNNNNNIDIVILPSK